MLTPFEIQRRQDEAVANALHRLATEATLPLRSVLLDLIDAGANIERACHVPTEDDAR